MWDVNVFDYYRTTPAVPVTEHSRFWRRADGLLRQAGLTEHRRHEEIARCSESLQADQDETRTLQELKQRLPRFSWKRELQDLPLFLAVYLGGLLGIYEHVLVPLAAHEPLQLNMAVTPGLLLQCIWVYLILKALLLLLAFEKPCRKYWGGIIGLFCLYLAGIWFCSHLLQPVLFQVNVLLLTMVLAAAAWLAYCRRAGKRRK